MIPLPLTSWMARQNIKVSRQSNPVDRLPEPDESEPPIIPPAVFPKSMEHLAIYPLVASNIIGSTALTLLVMVVEWILVQTGKLLFPDSLPWLILLLEELGLLEGVVIFIVVFFLGLWLTLKRAKQLIKFRSTEAKTQ